MSTSFATADRVASMGSLNLGAGAATVTYAPGKPINAKRLVFVVTTAQATAGAGITFGVRNVDDTSSVTKGSFTTPAVMALNAVYKADIAGVSTTAVTPTGEHSQPTEVTTGRVDGYYTNLPGELEINPGQELWVTSDGAGDTGVATVYVEYVEEGNNADRFSATDIAVTFA